MATRRFSIALYPALLAAVLVVALTNVSGVAAFGAIRSVVIVVIAALGLSCLGRVLLRDSHRGGVLAALWVLTLLAVDDVRLAAIVVVISALLFGEVYILPEAKRTIRWARVGRFFGRLVVILTVAIAIQALQLGAVTDALRSLTHETALRPALPDPANPEDPDIYMILLDGHARPDIIKDVFGRDVTAFLNALSADGFVVASKSRSNYLFTLEVLSSVFNQAHLADIDRMDGLLAGTEGRPPGAIARSVINDNQTFTFLRSRGYEIGAISGGFEQSAVREAEWFIDTGQISEFEIALLRRSILRPVIQGLAPDAVSGQHRARIQAVFDEFGASPSRPGHRPRFVFAHVPSPHAPWVYRADGSHRTVIDLQDFYAEYLIGFATEELALAYGDQLVDIDRRLLESLHRLDEGIEARSRSAVVVVFSDHGTSIHADGDIRLRYKNLLAVRATDHELVLEDNLTLVNLLPSLFEQLYGVPWVRRPDTQYQYARNVFDLMEVDDPDAAISP